jgi:hypothetical protein
LHQILIIETLQVMEPIFKKNRQLLLSSHGDFSKMHGHHFQALSTPLVVPFIMFGPFGITKHNKFSLKQKNIEFRHAFFKKSILK